MNTDPTQGAFTLERKPMVERWPECTGDAK